MTRKKVKLAFIENEAARKSTFRKRKTGLLKKANELATLCDVPICVLIESASDSAPEVWPSEEEAKKVLSQWEMLTETDRTKKMVNQETFLHQRIFKATESLKKLSKENKELEMKELMFDCITGKTSVSQINRSDLRHLDCFIDQYLKELYHRMETLSTNDVSPFSTLFGAAAAPAPTSNVMHMQMVELAASSAKFYDKIRIQIESTLNMKETNKDLDLNKTQW